MKRGRPKQNDIVAFLRQNPQYLSATQKEMAAASGIALGNLHRQLGIATNYEKTLERVAYMKVIKRPIKVNEMSFNLVDLLCADPSTHVMTISEIAAYAGVTIFRVKRQSARYLKEGCIERVNALRLIDSQERLVRMTAELLQELQNANMTSEMKQVKNEVKQVKKEAKVKKEVKNEVKKQVKKEAPQAPQTPEQKEYAKRLARVPKKYHHLKDPVAYYEAKCSAYRIDRYNKMREDPVACAAYRAKMKIGQQKYRDLHREEWTVYNRQKQAEYRGRNREKIAKLQAERYAKEKAQKAHDAHMARWEEKRMKKAK